VAVDRLDWICIALYAVVLLGIAAWHAGKMKHQDDVLLAGRSMASWPIAISMYMALFSTNTFLGYTGWLNRPDGTIWVGLQTVGILLAVPVVVWLYPALFFRLRITSAYEYLSLRFSDPVRRCATLFFLCSRLLWMATMLYSASLVISRMLGWTTTPSILLIGGLGIACALLGGMHAVIWTDVVQFFLLLAGLATMIVLGIQYSGGLGEVIRISADSGRFNAPPLFSLYTEISVVSGLALGLVGMLSASGADQVVLQQYLTARSEAVARQSLWRNGLFLKPVSLIYPFLGIIIFAYFHLHPEIGAKMRVPDDALPVFVMSVLPSGARGLMIVAMMAAVITSIESGMAAAAGALLAGRKKSVRSARLLLLGLGVLVVASALGIQYLGTRHSVFQILNIVMYPFAGVLLGIFLLGMLSHRANASGVLAGALLGFAATIAVPVSKLVAGSSAPPWIEALGRISTFYYGFLGTAITVATGLAASFLGPPPGPEKITGLTRRSLPPAR